MWPLFATSLAVLTSWASARSDPSNYDDHLLNTKHKIDNYLAKTQLLGKQRLQVEAKFLNTPLEYQYLNQYHNFEHPLTYTKLAPQFGLPYHGKGKQTYELQSDGPYLQSLKARNPYAQSPYSQSPYAKQGYAAPGYGGLPYGKPVYAQRPRVQTPYGQRTLGRPTYAQPAYPQQPYMMPSYGQQTFRQPNYAYPSSQPALVQTPYGQRALRQPTYSQAPVVQNRLQTTQGYVAPQQYAPQVQQPQAQAAYQQPQGQYVSDVDDGHDAPAYGQSQAPQAGYVQVQDAADPYNTGALAPDQGQFAQSGFGTL